MKILILILSFLIIGALIIISNNNLVLVNPNNFSTFANLYVDWVDNLYINLFGPHWNTIGVEWFSS